MPWDFSTSFWARSGLFREFQTSLSGFLEFGFFIFWNWVVWHSQKFFWCFGTKLFGDFGGIFWLFWNWVILKLGHFRTPFFGILEQIFFKKKPLVCGI